MCKSMNVFGVRIFFKALSCIMILFATGVQSIAQNSKDSVLNIEFGHSNTICYNLSKGLFTVVFDNRATILDAVAYSKGTKIVSSNQTRFTDYSITDITDAFGKGRKYIVSRSNSGNLSIQQVFYVYDSLDYFFIQTILTGENASSNYISSLSSKEVLLNGNNMLGLDVPFDNDMWVKYKVQKMDTAHFTSSEVTSLFDRKDNGGLIIGSLEHEIWKSGVKVEYAGNRNVAINAFAGFTDSITTHDRNVHGVVSENGGALCRSPKIMVGYFKDWRTGMEVYGNNNRLAEPPFIFNWAGGTPMGWNSWGVLKDKLTLKKAKGVVDFFYDSCKLFRTEDSTLFIDLDSYWDGMVNGGLNGDVRQLKSFVSYCKQRGFKPGIYWAPFADWGKRDVVVEGSDYHYSQCWTKAGGRFMDIDGGRALDPTHPATKARIVYYADFFKRCGFQMIKVDFLAHGSLEADNYYDKNVHTGMQAYKEGMEFLDKQLGGQMLVYAAISPSLATARYVHMRRIACDAFKSIDETAYTLNSTRYGWWLGDMYNFLDADHVVFSGATDGENRARFASAIVTGTLITGDDYDSTGRWRYTAQDLLQRTDLLKVVAHDGKPFRPLEIQVDDNIGAAFTKKVGKDLYVALFNYSDKELKITFPTDIQQATKGKWDQLLGAGAQDVMASKSTVTISVPPKDAAIWKCFD